MLAGHSEISPKIVAAVLLLVFGADASAVMHPQWPPAPIPEEVRPRLRCRRRRKKSTKINIHLRLRSQRFGVHS